MVQKEVAGHHVEWAVVGVRGAGEGGGEGLVHDILFPALEGDAGIGGVAAGDVEGHGAAITGEDGKWDAPGGGASGEGDGQIARAGGEIEEGDGAAAAAGDGSNRRPEQVGCAGQPVESRQASEGAPMFAWVDRGVVHAFGREEAVHLVASLVEADLVKSGRADGNSAHAGSTPHLQP